MQNPRTLGNTPVWLMVVLSMITAGIYPFVWILKTMKTVNGLHTKKKLSRNLVVTMIAAAAISVVAMVMGFLVLMAGAGPDGSLSDTAIYVLIFLDSLRQLTSLIYVILNLIVCFRIKGMLSQHYNDYLGLNISFSGVATFFLNIFYLQYKMNRLPAPAAGADTAAPVQGKITALPPAAATAPAYAADLNSPYAKLHQLKDLLDCGLLTSQEFELKKARLLEEF